MAETRPGVLNITLIQNENYDLSLFLTNEYTGEPELINSASDILLSVKESHLSKPEFTLSLGNGITILSPSSIRVFMAGILTRRLNRTRYQYDILFMLNSGTNPTYLIKGQINVINTNTKQQ